ncbi:MAG: EAL domain-containing protein [Gammaproteobacteria bacterium]
MWCIDHGYPKYLLAGQLVPYMLQLLRNFTITCVLGTVILTAVLGYLYREQEISSLIELGENQNTMLVQVFANTIWPNFRPYLDSLQSLNAAELKQHAGIRGFDREIREQVRKSGILSASLISNNGNTFFSTIRRQLGIKHADNPGFQLAKSGSPSSNFIYRDIVNSLDELKLDRYTVVSYIPIRAAGNANVEAVFELHLDVTNFVEAIEHRTSLAYLVVGLLLSTLTFTLLFIVKNADGVIQGLAATLRRQEKYIEHQGYHDMLTGLPNRLLFRDKLEDAMKMCLQKETLLALLFIDLDHFQKINDALGYAIGDQVLLEVSNRLKLCIRSNDTVSRVGGDEFVIILEALSVLDEAEDITRQIIKTVSEPLEFDGNEIFVTPSIGIAAYPFNEDNVNSLLKKANSAMAKAKQAGRNTFRYFTESSRQQLVSRFSIENALRRALEREEFELYFQPVVQIKTGKVTAVEALLRWRSAELGFTSPLEFIPLLEETGLIVPVGQWVLQHACLQGIAWKEQGIGDLKINVNMSAKQLLHKNLVKHVNDALDLSGLNPHLLDLELTESLLIEDFDKTIRILDRLNETGVSLSVDDFGTGYSSLSYLKRMPVDTLKIDQSFIKDITANIDDAAIVTAICALSRSLRFKVTAEGVENIQQLEFLRRAEVNAVQGFLFSRPLSVADVEPVLRQGNLLKANDSVA